MKPKKKLSWDRACSAEDRWRHDAYEALVSGMLRHERAEHAGIGVSTVTGPCPRCGHDVGFTFVHTALLEDSGPGRRHVRALAGSPAPVPIDVQCRCGGNHPGRPEGEYGCGLVFPIGV